MAFLKKRTPERDLADLRARRTKLADGLTAATVALENAAAARRRELVEGDEAAALAETASYTDRVHAGTQMTMLVQRANMHAVHERRSLTNPDGWLRRAKAGCKA